MILRLLSSVPLVAVALITQSVAADTARTAADNDALTFKRPDRSITYGNRHPSQQIHARMPDPEKHGDGPYPLVILYHGGCFVRDYGSMQNISALADALRDEGYVTINAGYRRVDEKDGGWPGTYYDAAETVDRTVAWARSMPIDQDKVATLGHAAGGTLALFGVARESLAEQSPLYFKRRFPIKGAVSLGGNGDPLAAREGLAKACGVDAITALLGGAAMRQWNAKSISATSLVPYSGKQVLIVGDQDTHMSVGEATAYKTTVETAGGAVDLVTLAGVGHHDYVNPGNTATFTAITEALRSIFSND